METHSWDDWRDQIASNSLRVEEWRAAAEARLAELGLTYEQLAKEAREGNFSSTAARKLWVLIGGTL